MATHPASPAQCSPPSLPGRSGTRSRSDRSAGVVRYILLIRLPSAGWGDLMTQPRSDAEFPLGPDGLPDLPLRVLEDDENIPPRPEEGLADLERTDPQAP